MIQNSNFSPCSECRQWEESYRNVLSEFKKLKEGLSLKNPSIHSMPEYMKPKDLMALGFYRSVHSVYRARLQGKGLPFIRVGRSIFYPKDAVAKFIEESLEKSTCDKGL